MREGRRHNATRPTMSALEGIYEVPNKVLDEVLVDAMAVAGRRCSQMRTRRLPEKSPRRSSGAIPGVHARRDAPDEMKEKLEGKLLNDTVLGRPPIAPEMRGSTDVGDVSWCVPTSSSRLPAWPWERRGTPWQYTAQVRHAYRARRDDRCCPDLGSGRIAAGDRPGDHTEGQG